RRMTHVDQTVLIVWEIDDPAKAGDARYWWSEEDAERLRGFMPEAPDLAGRPKGAPLGSLRAADGAVELSIPDIDHDREDRILVSIDSLREADPARTYVIVTHRRRASAEQIEPPWPPEVEAMRREWVGALADQDTGRAHGLKRALDAELEALG